MDSQHLRPGWNKGCSDPSLSANFTLLTEHSWPGLCSSCLSFSSCSINNIIKQQFRTGRAIPYYRTVRRPYQPITVSFNLVGGLHNINYDGSENCEDFILDQIGKRIFPGINNYMESTEFINTRCHVSEWNVQKSEESWGDNRPLITSSLVTNININIHQLDANRGQFESGWRARLRNAFFIIQ